MPADTVDIAIIGGGIAGLVAASAIAKHVSSRIRVHVFEQSRLASFGESTGGAIGLYANGLAVLRDIDNELLETVCSQGLPYANRRWRRHDGTEIAVGDETLLVPRNDDDGSFDPRLQPLGIRRWRFLSALLDQTKKHANIKVHFEKRIAHDGIQTVTETNGSSSIQIHKLKFKDGTEFTARLVLGADGVKSQVRAYLFPETKQPEYTGVTTLMAVARIPPTADPSRPEPLSRGIHFISSRTSKFHACMYPLPNDEINVQIYIPTPEHPETWGKLDADEMKAEADAMVAKLRADGWNETFVQPWLNPDSVIRVGLRAREPLEKWSKGGTMVLLGDAAHPPVPYIGQGAMQAIEDAGVLALLIKHLCPVKSLGNAADGPLDWDLSQFETVTRLYEQIRVERCTQVLRSSHVLGEMNQRRADSWFYNLQYEWSIWMQVLAGGNLPIMLQGVYYSYADEVDKAIAGAGSDTIAV
ncbi:hypothetical protein HDU81_007684 [Chytriomyces hyalinus]|nr:hypothetical protein HDU81_007684 [Chytriomyces hyalinus]